MSEGGFSTDWLTLREPADRRARNQTLLGKLAEWCAGRDALVVLDLGAGTGSSARALAPRLGSRQTWRLADIDPVLMAAAQERLQALQNAKGEAIAVEWRICDLTKPLPAALLDGVDLVVTSAFLDLVSRAWIEGLAQVTQRKHVPVYAALTVDGTNAAFPPIAGDAGIFRSFDRHMSGDKGFGAALGHKAAEAAAGIFSAAGFIVETGRADWLIAADGAELQRQLIGGWSGAAREIAMMSGAAHDGTPDVSAAADPAIMAGLDIDTWQAQRLAAVAAGTSSLSVGHIDLLAWPT